MKRLPMLVLLTAPYVLLLLYLSENGPLLPPCLCWRVCGTVFWGYIRIFPAPLGISE